MGGHEIVGSGGYASKLAICPDELLSTAFCSACNPKEDATKGKYWNVQDFSFSLVPVCFTCSLALSREDCACMRYPVLPKPFMLLS